MKTFNCSKCGSTDVFLLEKGSQTGLYCGDCGNWIKWVGRDEKNLVERWISSSNRLNDGNSTDGKNQTDT